ncbi:interferon-induced GTP-binding protein Mx-like [Liolophura sinensis]|uniref:interferon-induced GTP-binding protein Mx-like n=1 Tax=Liolophura sinensis TaxID=3198878 RepID=UPI00315894A6
MDNEEFDSQERSTPEAQRETAPSLTQAFDDQVRPYIDLIDNLRAYGLDKDVGLPAVAVIGDQSSGKSSTLEAISGIQLPRGSGIVTRCPLELRMKCDRGESPVWSSKLTYTDKHGEEHCKVMDHPEAVEGAVREAQDAMTDGDAGISSDLITLEVTSSSVPDLTLIDLPGIARVAVEGQPLDIGDQIKNLIHHYITKQETIILVVIPSNVDIATTEALQLSQLYDKHGERSLGVLTKPDLIDKGAEAQVLRAVNNQVIHLKKGYTMVKCRGQAAVDKKQTLQEAIQDEKDFFEYHDKFRDLSQEQRGIPSLAIKLTTELVDQIKKIVPELKKDVKMLLDETREKLRILGEGLPESKEGRQSVLLETATNFTSFLLMLARGDYATKMTPDMRLLTVIRKKFDTFGIQAKGQAPRDGDISLIEDIKEQIQDYRGRELPNFIMYPMFEALVRDVVSKMKDPSIYCLKDVDKSIEKVLNKLCEKYFGRFPRIIGEVKTIVSELRLSAKTTTEEELHKQFEMEALIYSQDNTYLQEIEAIQIKRAQLKAKQQKQMDYSMPVYETPEKTEQTEAEHILDALKAYFKVASRRVTDMAPMIIRYQMLEVLVKNIKTELIKYGANLENATNVEEDPYVRIERANLTEKKERLVRAEMELNKF